MDVRSRRSAERRGRSAETLAALYLVLKGYKVLARRARTPFGEVDIVARKGDVLAVVEVKARRTLGQGLEAVGPQAQERIARAGLAVCQRLRLRGMRLRLDVIVIGAGLRLRHVRDAWRVNESGRR